MSAQPLGKYCRQILLWYRGTNIQIHSPFTEIQVPKWLGSTGKRARILFNPSLLLYFANAPKTDSIARQASVGEAGSFAQPIGGAAGIRAGFPRAAAEDVFFAL